MGSIKRQLFISLFLALCGVFSNRAETLAQDRDDLPSGKEGFVLKSLGTAGWKIQIGQTVILIDPFLTRKEPDRLGKEWKTDGETVLRAIKRADYIFAGHSHADHIGDIPFIAKKFGSKAIGSRTKTNLALIGGVDKSRPVTISGGEKLSFSKVNGLISGIGTFAAFGVIADERNQKPVPRRKRRSHH